MQVCLASIHVQGTKLAGHTAVDTLLAVGALTTDDTGPPRLTGLGSHLAALPLDVHIAKMLVYACMLHCVSPVLTIAAAMAYGRPMFVAPADKRAEVLLPQQSFQVADQILCTGGCSQACAVGSFCRQPIRSHCDGGSVQWLATLHRVGRPCWRFRVLPAILLGGKVGKLFASCQPSTQL